MSTPILHIQSSALTLMQQIQKDWLHYTGIEGIFYRAFWHYCLKLRLGHAPYYRLIFSRIKNYTSSGESLEKHWQVVQVVLQQWDQSLLNSYQNYCLHKTQLHWQHPQNLHQQIVSYWHPDYPASLRDLFDPPILLFFRGNLKGQINPTTLKKPHWACVGSRNPRFIDEKDFDSFFKQWNETKHGVPILISGGARGIDSMSHQFALKRSWPTWVVLGHGLQHTYPQENEFLYDRIIEAGGALISEYEAEVPPLKYHFVARNRIIAALADVLIVAQAKRGSGSLITAQFALDLNRKVVIWPPHLHEPEFTGSYELVRQGASLVESCQQV